MSAITNNLNNSVKDFIYDYDEQSKKHTNNIKLSNEISDTLAAELDIGNEQIKSMQFEDNVTRKMRSIMSAYDANVTFLTEKTQPEVITTKKIMADGTIVTITKKDGKVVEESKKKPHMVPVVDPVTQQTKLEPFVSVFEDI